MSGGEVHDPPEYEAHDFQRTIPSDGRWCQRCGLAEARWVGEPCIGRITPEFFEAELVEVRSRLADTEAERDADADVLTALVREVERADKAEDRVRVLTEALTAWLEATRTWTEEPASYRDVIAAREHARALLTEGSG